MKNHPYNGMHRTVTAHIRSAAIHQKALAALPLPHLVEKKQATDIAGCFLRAQESQGRLHDAALDVVCAIRFLKGTAAPEQDAVGPFSEAAFIAKHASQESKDAAADALRGLLSEMNDAMKANLPVLKTLLVDAKTALVKHAAAGMLDTKSLRASGGAGLQLLEGTLVYRHLPAEVIHGHGGLTESGEKTLAGHVMKDYLRELEDVKILVDEYAESDKRAARKAMEDRAKAALNSLGVE